MEKQEYNIKYLELITKVYFLIPNKRLIYKNIFCDCNYVLILTLFKSSF